MVGLGFENMLNAQRKSSHDGMISSFELSCQIFFDQRVLFRSVTSPNFWSRDFPELARNFRIVLVRSWILFASGFFQTKKPNSFLTKQHALWMQCMPVFIEFLATIRRLLFTYQRDYLITIGLIQFQ